MALEIEELLKSAVEQDASDVFIVAGLPVSYRINDVIKRSAGDRIMPEKSEQYVKEIYSLAGNRDMKHFLEHGDDDFAFAIPGVSRFRVNAYKQRGAMSLVIRVITFELPDYKTLSIPESVMDLANVQKGMVLVTGSAGSGKSTTLSCIVNAINNNQEKHIITLEDPIEFLHSHNKSIISQREIDVDTDGYVPALRAALRQSPDVILVGEMRDTETIQIAMTAAETGHFVMSTLHTVGAANTINRIIDGFPSEEQQRQIAIQLSLVLKAVVSQQLVPTVDGKVVPAFEIMTVNTAIANMIRDNKVAQIKGQIEQADTPTMLSMDVSLLKLVKEGRITKETALTYAVNADMLARNLGVMR